MDVCLSFPENLNNKHNFYIGHFFCIGQFFYVDLEELSNAGQFFSTVL